MKSVQILIDDKLLRKLDADEDVQKLGRSAVIRQMAAEYLLRRRRSAIAREYRAAYGVEAGLGNEFEGWEKEGQWPTE